MLVSFAPGRVRIRDNAFKNESVMEKTLKILTKMPDLLTTAPNRITGSILITYDVKKLDAENVSELQTVIKKAVPSLADYFETKKPASKAFNRTMLGAFAMCATTPFFGMYKLHKWSACLFAGLMAKHIIDYRKKIF